jgi:hypothetical protein
MNKRIIEFGLKAHLLNYIDNETPPNYFVSGYADQQEVIDFAQLIIQECIDIITPYSWSLPGEEYPHPISVIKDRFGIEGIKG